MCNNGHPLEWAQLKLHQGWVHNRECRLCGLKISREAVRLRCEHCRLGVLAFGFNRDKYSVCSGCFLEAYTNPNEDSAAALEQMENCNGELLVQIPSQANYENKGSNERNSQAANHELDQTVELPSLMAEGQQPEHVATAAVERDEQAQPSAEDDAEIVTVPLGRLRDYLVSCVSIC